jgi:hypothetical protein
MEEACFSGVFDSNMNILENVVIAVKTEVTLKLHLAVI